MKLTDLNEILCESIPDVTVRKKAVESALCKAVAYSLRIPSEAVESIGEYYRDTHADFAGRIVDSFNEIYPVNVTLVNDMVRSMFIGRYNLVHTPALVEDNQLSALMNCASVRYHIPEPHQPFLFTTGNLSLSATLRDYVSRYAPTASKSLESEDD